MNETEAIHTEHTQTPSPAFTPTSLSRCVANTCLAIAPLVALPVLFWLPSYFSVLVPSEPLRTAVLLLLVAIPIIFLTALFILFQRVHSFFTPAAGIALRHVLSVGVVVTAYGAFICWVFLSLGQLIPDLSGLQN